MRPPLDDARRILLKAAFRMPAVQTMVSRKSSITNAFVSSLLPVIKPTAEEIDEALGILGLDPASLRCAYCGAECTQWDHLRPLVIGRRPTGYISEIGNLVPACGRCNSSKGNSTWRTWMSGQARNSPSKRRVPDLAQRIAKLDVYEQWRPPTRIDFDKIVGADLWARYWASCDAVNQDLKRCKELADQILEKARHSLRSAERMVPAPEDE